MSYDDRLGDYIDVPSRIAEFREKHPEGSLQPATLAEPFQIREVGGDTYIVVVAAAYRSPEDRRPGVGMAYEVYPGKTPYTKGSELQNAETSAWGRAIVAVLAADTKRGIASANEVRNRQAEREQWEQAKPAPTREPVVAQPPTAEQVAEYERLLADLSAASTLDALTAVGKAVYQARAEGYIIQAQYDDLGDRGLAKKAELQQAEAAS